MWAAYYIDDEEVSREEFFRRSTPSARLFQDRCQSESGAPSPYASAEEVESDLVEVFRDGGSGEEEARRLAAWSAAEWAKSEHGRAAGEAA